eukprot:4762891-Amphidinium_carterae.1
MKFFSPVKSRRVCGNSPCKCGSSASCNTLGFHITFSKGAVFCPMSAMITSAFDTKKGRKRGKRGRSNKKTSARRI